MRIASATAYGGGGLERRGQPPGAGQGGQRGASLGTEGEKEKGRVQRGLVDQAHGEELNFH